MIQLYIYLCSFSCSGGIYLVVSYALYICLPSVLRLSVKDLVTLSFILPVFRLTLCLFLVSLLKILIGFSESESLCPTQSCPTL